MWFLGAGAYWASTINRQWSMAPKSQSSDQAWIRALQMQDIFVHAKVHFFELFDHILNLQL